MNVPPLLPRQDGDAQRQHSANDIDRWGVIETDGNRLRVSRRANGSYRSRFEAVDEQHVTD
ncbi:MAG: hypothetical protein ABI650_09710, partial [Dokdonella sp.]